MLISELFDAICWEISVESGSTDFQLVDDITDEWIIFCVFEHRFSMLDGLFIHCPWTIATGSRRTVSVRCAPPNGADFDGLVSTIDSGHLGALYGCEAEEAALAG